MPMPKGHKHSEEAKAKMRANNVWKHPEKFPDRRKQQSDAMLALGEDHQSKKPENKARKREAQLALGENHPQRQPEMRKHQSEVALSKGENHQAKSSECRAKHSVIVTDKILAGKWCPKTLAKHGWYFSPKTNKKHYYRSSFELAAYKILEQMSEVVSFETETLRIPYVAEDGNKHFYVPDILVTYQSGKRELIEVTAKWELEAKRFRLEAGRSWCSSNNTEFVVWTQNNLGL